MGLASSARQSTPRVSRYRRALAWASVPAREQGWAVETFLTMCEPDGNSKSHALPPELIAAQVAALGGQWLPVRVAPGGYAAAFDAALAGLRADGIRAVVFGDIDLQAHRDWLEPACARAGLLAVFPLWGEPRAALAAEVIARGLQARLVCVDLGRMPADCCGARYDQALLARLPAGVCPVGEDGEFHTVVLDGPGFAAPLRVEAGTPCRVDTVPPWQATTLLFQPLRLLDALP